MTNIEETITYSPTGKTGLDDSAGEIKNRNFEQARQYHCS